WPGGTMVEGSATRGLISKRATVRDRESKGWPNSTRQLRVAHSGLPGTHPSFDDSDAHHGLRTRGVTRPSDRRSQRILADSPIPKPYRNIPSKTPYSPGCKSEVGVILHTPSSSSCDVYST